MTNLNQETIDFLNDYADADNMYLCDAISEFADGRTSIYYSDIKKFISENVDAVNDAVAEFGWDGCGSDLMKAGQIAEFLTIENKIYEDLSNFDNSERIETLKEDEDFKALIEQAKND